MRSATNGGHWAALPYARRQDAWVPATRVVAGILGATAAVYGLRRRDRLGAAVGLAGVVLLVRGAANTRLGQLVPVPERVRNVEIEETIVIDAPVARVYAFLTEWERWPQWMSHVREVSPRGKQDGRERTHWIVDGPLGVPVSWDAVTTSLVPNEEIAWETIPGAAVEHAGVIRLTAVSDERTRVHVLMSYHPPAGVVGHAVAASVRRDPKRQMETDLSRLKTTIESGRPPEVA
jgi:uncharacterized membrane protein